MYIYVFNCSIIYILQNSTLLVYIPMNFEKVIPSSNHHHEWGIEAFHLSPKIPLCSQSPLFPRPCPPLMWPPDVCFHKFSRRLWFTLKFRNSRIILNPQATSWGFMISMLHIRTSWVLVRIPRSPFSIMQKSVISYLKASVRVGGMQFIFYLKYLH